MVGSDHDTVWPGTGEVRSEGRISINEARARGIRNLRLDDWANPKDHIELNILPDGLLGPWVTLVSPWTGEESQQVMILQMGDLDATIWRPYENNIAISGA